MEIIILSCNRCGHKWAKRKSGGKVPKTCPKCKSPYYNRERKRMIKNKA